MSTSAQHFLRNSTRIVGNRDACQHAGHLLHALPCRQNAQTASSGLARKLFLHAPVIVTARSHLRQMRHTEDLTLSPSLCRSCPTTSAVAPPMPLSTSSKMSVGTGMAAP